jgi:beta-glucosidase
LSTFANLHFALQRDMVSEADIDTAVKRLFRTRFKLGMFDPPEQVPYTDIPESTVGSEQHLKLAQTMSEQSLVLLKNNGLLPLAEGKRVAVIGPNAINPDVLVGNYNGDPIDPVLPLAGIEQYAGADNVDYAPGSPLAGDVYGHYRPVPADRFFHREDGELKPGVVGEYYEIDPEGEWQDEPAKVRVDEDIDFHWQKSPLDETTVRDEFGITWKGVLVPAQGGSYHFESRAAIKLDGETVDGPVELEADREYAFEATTDFRRAWWGHPLEPSIQVRWANTAGSLADEAANIAKKADVIVFTGGISPLLEGEEMDVDLDGFDHGDRTQIGLPREQLALLKRLKATGKPVVLVNFSGSAMALNWEDENLDAIVQAFYPGEATGTALARLLWGEYSPSGRLPVTFYRGVDDLPGFKDYSMTNRTYKYYEGEPLYPFGHGLSYSEFVYSELDAPERIDAGDGLELFVTLKNNGPMDAAEVSQLYLSMPEAPVEVPKRELAGYTRTPLAAGSQNRVKFTITPEQLRYVDNNGGRRPYLGPLKIAVGGGQPGYVQDKQITKATVIVE